MKSLWVATGVVVGLGVAGLVAAAAGDGSPGKIIGGDTVVDESTTSTATTSTTVDETTTTVEATAAETTTVGIVPIAGLPTTSPSTTPAPSTTYVPTPPASWHKVGDSCSPDGAVGNSPTGAAVVCAEGAWRLA